MSLTNYLTGTEHKALRDKFKTEFTRPVFTLKNLRTTIPLTKNHSLVGAAFDYLLRFHIAYHNKDKKVGSRNWVAGNGCREILKRRCSYVDFCQRLESRYTAATKNHQLFLQNGRMTNTLIKDALFLAKLDLNVRAGLTVPDLLSENAHDCRDLRNLYNRINKKTFGIKNHGHLNPVFAGGSSLVGGADADLILDDVLIDIKCTKELKLTRYYLNQVIGYYLLALIHNEKAPQNGRYTINHLGIYFARHGVLWTFPVSHLGSKRKIKAFKDWFCHYIEKYRRFL